MLISCRLRLPIRLGVIPIGTILLSMLLGGSCWAEQVVFVREGQAVHATASGAPWRTTEDGLTGSGVGNLLRLNARFGEGDFRFTARLTLRNLSRSAASVVVNGSHFGFEGADGQMFVEGPLFSARKLGPPRVREGQPFELGVRRQGDRLAITLDGVTAHEAALPHTTEVSLALRPWRSTMSVAEAAGQGAAIPAEPPPPARDVFVSGRDGYHTYRIPAIVATAQGDLLAFCEGRKSGRGDSGDIDLLVRRSSDQGATWSESIVVWDDGGNTCGNPCPVLDRDTGWIWLAMTWNHGEDREAKIMDGSSRDVRQVFVTHSKDGGRTWAPPVRISETTRRDDWRWYATGPGHAIQLTRGPHAGRLLIPANHSDHDEGGHPFRSHVFWSDDHGQTWRLGGVHQDRTNESAVVELADGSILQAMRSYHGRNRRAMSVSGDGGRSWSDVYLEEALDTPVCQASLLRTAWPDEATGAPGLILFCSPQGVGRSQLTVWVSRDEGKTWPLRRLVYDGPAAYSDMAPLPEGRVGVLFEKDDYRSISWIVLEPELLTP